MNDKKGWLVKALGAQGPRQGNRGCKDLMEGWGQARLPEEQQGGQGGWSIAREGAR